MTLGLLHITYPQASWLIMGWQLCVNKLMPRYLRPPMYIYKYPHRRIRHAIRHVPKVVYYKIYLIHNMLITYFTVAPKSSGLCKWVCFIRRETVLSNRHMGNQCLTVWKVSGFDGVMPYWPNGTHTDTHIYMENYSLISWQERLLRTYFITSVVPPGDEIRNCVKNGNTSCTAFVKYIT